MNNFAKLGLSLPTTEVLESLGFETPTEVQSKAIPMLLSNDPCNFIGLAQTGTGKTAAFGLPLIDLIDEDFHATQALVLSPTRELGQQTGQQLKEFTQNRSMNIEVVYGGASISTQIKALKRPTQIVVATPGRLRDLIKRRAVSLEYVSYVVLDEADEMLNMGFKEEIDEILEHTPDERVTWLFSATMPKEIRKIINKYMDNPIEVSVNTKEISNKDITHQYVMTKTANKVPALRRFLDIQPEMRGVMFCRTKRETQQIADDLGQLGYGVEALHGDLSQQQREVVMKRFKTRSMQLLIATDVAARGIDVNDLSHVIHHTLPDQVESYTHRSGRTGRAGKKGISLAFINPREGRKISELEKKLKVVFEKMEVPSLEELKSSRINNWANVIINTEVDPQSEEIVRNLHGPFSHLSKEELLKRMVTMQLDHLMIKGGEESNLNEIHGTPKKDHGGDPAKYNRYFVNIGTIDGVTKGDLIHFLSDISQVERKHFGEMNLKKNCAFFEVDKTKDQGFANYFKGIEVEGRDLRVNRDDNASIDSKKAKSRPKRQNRGRSRKRGRRR